jgi:hypothetical protein
MRWPRRGPRGRAGAGEGGPSPRSTRRLGPDERRPVAGAPAGVELRVPPHPVGFGEDPRRTAVVRASRVGPSSRQGGRQTMVVALRGPGPPRGVAVTLRDGAQVRRRGRGRVVAEAPGAHVAELRGAARRAAARASPACRMRYARAWIETQVRTPCAVSARQAGRHSTRCSRIAPQEPGAVAGGRVRPAVEPEGDRALELRGGPREQGGGGRGGALRVGRARCAHEREERRTGALASAPATVPEGEGSGRRGARSAGAG